MLDNFYLYTDLTSAVINQSSGIHGFINLNQPCQQACTMGAQAQPSTKSTELPVSKLVLWEPKHNLAPRVLSSMSASLYYGSPSMA